MRAASRIGFAVILAVGALGWNAQLSRAMPKRGGAKAKSGIKGSSGVAGIQGHRESAVDAGKLTLALKFVEFIHNGAPVLTEPQAHQVVRGLNGLYAQCAIEVRLERYEQVNPSSYGLGGPISTPDEMDGIRTPFDSDRYLVVIHTGNWNHGPMGPANAWTAMPGQLPSGAVMESSVADNDNITAHELGHYLGLDHASDEAELMNPIIYSTSTRLTPTECRQMRETALTSRANALRTT